MKCQRLLQPVSRKSLAIEAAAAAAAAGTAAAEGRDCSSCTILCREALVLEATIVGFFVVSERLRMR
jgi:hypothetical protein